MTAPDFFALASAARIRGLQVQIDVAKRRRDFRTVRVLLAEIETETT